MGGDWALSQFWSDGVPTANSTVLIGPNGNVTVGLVDPLAFAGDIFLSSGTSALTITNGVQLTAQSLSVNASPVSVLSPTSVDTRVLLNSSTSTDLRIGTSGSASMSIGTNAIVTTGTGASPETVLGVTGGTGTLTLNGGALETNAIGVGTGSVGNLNISGGTLRALQSRTDFVASLPGLSVTLSSDAKIDTNGFDVGIAEVLQGSGSLLKQGTGTLTLTGANTYTGRTQVSAGTLVLDGSGASLNHGGNGMTVGFGTGDNGHLQIQNGAKVTSASGLVGQLSGSQGTALVSGAGSTWTMGGGLSVGSGGTGSLTIENGATVTSTNGALGFAAGSSGTVLLTGPSSTWSTTIAGGDITIGGSGTGVLTVADGARLNANAGGAAVTLAGGANSSGTLNIGNGGAAGTINAFTIRGAASGGTATLNFNHNSPNYYFTRDGTSTGGGMGISDNLTLNVNGTGRTTLLASNTFTGPVNFNSGALGITLDGALGNAANVLTFNGGELVAAGNVTTSRTANLGAGGGTLSADAGATFTYNGLITGAGKLTKSGDGILLLNTGANYSGGTDVNAGTLRLGLAGAAGGGNITTAAGATLSLANGVTSNNPWVLAGNANLEVLNSDSATQLGIISETGGSRGFTKTGTGTLILNNTNSYTGGTTIAGGVLSVIADSNLGNASGGLAFTGGSILRITTTMATSRATTIAGGNFLVDPGMTLTHNGSISGSGTLAKTGAGTMVLTGADTATGDTSVSDGTLKVQGASASISGSGDLYVGDAGTTNAALQILNGATVNRSTATIGNLAGATGNVTVNGANSLLSSSIITVGGSGAGQLTIAAGGKANSSAGVIADEAGSTGAATVTGAGSLWQSFSMEVGFSGAGTLTVADGGEVRVNGGNAPIKLGEFGTATLDIGTGAAAGVINATQVQGIGATTAGVNFNHTDSNYYFTKDGTASTAGVAITGATAVANINTGKTTLSGANTYTGGTTISAGIISISANNGLGDAATGLAMSNGGLLETTSTMTFSRATTLGSGGGGGFQPTAGTTLTATGAITGNTLIKSGAGMLVLPDAKAYTGGTSVRGGTLRVDGGTIGQSFSNVNVGVNANETASLEVANGGTVNSLNGRLGSGGTGNGAATISGATSQWNILQSLTVGDFGAGALTVQSGALVSIQNGNIGSGAGSSGSVMVTGTNSHLSNGQALNIGPTGTGTLEVAAGGRVDLGTGSLGSQSGGSGTATISDAGSLINVVTGSLAVGGQGSGTLNVNGGKVTSPSVALGSSGGVGTINIGTGTTAGVLDTLVVTGGGGTAAVNFNHDASNYYFTRNGAAGGTGVILDGPLSLNQIGSGTTTLTAANFHSGPTTVQAGALSLGTVDALQNATGLVSVLGGRLDSTVANVNLGGDLTVNGGALGVNGAGIGTITLAPNNDFTLLSGAAEFTFNGLSSFDQILGNGGLFSISGGAFDLTNTIPNYSATYQLLNGFSTGTVSGLSFTHYDSANFLAKLDNTGKLSFTAVPEPATWSLLAAGLLAALAAARRRPAKTRTKVARNLNRNAGPAKG